MAKYCIGIDLGGTYVKFGLLDEKRQPSETFQLRTPESSNDVVQQMVHGAEKLLAERRLSKADIVGVGIGSPGPLNLADGVVIAMPNVSGMENLPLRDLVGEGLALPAALENDANAAAYGEYLCGAAKGARNMVLLTLGTGLGSGIILDGEILHGSQGIGGEVGHMIVAAGGRLCGCGQRGCLERYCSATYIAEYAKQQIEEENRAGLLAAVLKQAGSITSKDIAEAAEAGDEFAAEVWDRGAYYLAVGCVNLCRIFDPDKIVLSGGLTHAGEALMKPLMVHLNKLHWSLTDVMTEIEIAQLGNDAGAIGAAGVAWAAFG